MKILVKKSDGSFVHVPLSELDKKPAPKPPVAPVRVAKLPEQSISPVRRAVGVNMADGPKATKLPEPVKHDLSSPLEEPAPAIHPAMPLRSSGREDQIESIMKSLSFKVPVGNVSRFRTVIQLFLKDIRGERETIEILTRKEIEGGVGLSEGQAEEAVQKAKQKNVSTPPPKFDPRESIRLEQEVPALIRAMPSMQKLKAIPVVPQKMPIPAAPKTEFKISSERVKTTMSDVKTPFEYAPVDEIRYFSLTDFRRIAGNPTDAAARLKQKFMNLREESILLFFEALEAWRSSPLYLDYLSSVSESLSKRTPLARSQDKLKIQSPEIAAILMMEKDF